MSELTTLSVEPKTAPKCPKCHQKKTGRTAHFTDLDMGFIIQWCTNCRYTQTMSAVIPPKKESD